MKNLLCLVNLVERRHNMKKKIKKKSKKKELPEDCCAPLTDKDVAEVFEFLRRLKRFAVLSREAGMKSKVIIR